MNDETYLLASCPHDGEMWLEQGYYRPATRWEPEDFDLHILPCPKCGNEENLYTHDTLWGGFAVAALECAYVIGSAIEWWGLNPCTRCGKPAWEGGSMCPPCVYDLADAYYAEPTD